MRKQLNWLIPIVGILAILGIMGRSVIFQDSSSGEITSLADNSQESGSSIAALDSPIGPPTPTPPPTRTMPPVPTPLPTPAVTRVPLAKAPFIPLPPSESKESFSIIFRDEDILKRIDGQGRDEKVIVDIHQRTSLYLGRRSAGVFQWGSASPDGQHIAVVLVDFKNRRELPKPGASDYKIPYFGIYLVDTITGEPRKLIDGATKPSWSPDGERLAYHNIITQSLDVIDVATGNVQTLFSPEPESGVIANWFTWAPDGSRLAFVKSDEGIVNTGGLWVVDAREKDKVRSLGDLIDTDVAGLSWSPTGNQILFTSSKGEHTTPEIPANLWVIDVSNGEQRQITYNMTYVGPTIWSPDGEWISFTGTNLLEGEDYQYDLWIVSQKGDVLKRITDDAISDIDAQATVDYNQMVFNKEESGIWSIDLVNGNLHQVYPRNTGFWLLQ